MRRHNSTIPHDPVNGQWGDCHRACFAMILGLDPTEVPHFYDGGRDQCDAVADMRRFLAARGLAAVDIAFRCDFGTLMAMMTENMPGVPAILGGISAKDCGHSVVALDGAIWHDPSGSGIVAPFEDGHYWITIFSPLAVIPEDDPSDG